MTDNLDLKTMKLLVAQMKAMSVRPKIIETQAQADEQNEKDSAIGIKHRWRVGDHYYNVGDFLK